MALLKVNIHNVLTDLSMFTAKKGGPEFRVAGVYLIRVREGKFFIDFIQQYNVVGQRLGCL